MFTLKLQKLTLKITDISMQGNIGVKYSFQNKLAFDRIFPIELRENISESIHDRINMRFIDKADQCFRAMSCDWTCTSEYWQKANNNLPKQDLRGPFNTNLIIRSIRPF